MLNVAFVRSPILALLSVLVLAPWAIARDTSDPYWDHRSGAERGEFDYDDSGDVPWRELAAEIPPLPNSAEFLPLQLDTLPRGMRAFLHLDSLTVGERDAVVRYWLLLTGQGGGFNATYEGVKCNTGEYKVYAYGNPERQRKVRVMPDPKWRAHGASRHDLREELTRDYLCTGVTPRTLTQIESEVRHHSGYEDPLQRYLY